MFGQQLPLVFDSPLIPALLVALMLLIAAVPFFIAL
jgi:hypothetical protein